MYEAGESLRCVCVRLPYVSAALSFAIGQLFLPFCWMGIRVAAKVLDVHKRLLWNGQ